MIARIMSKKDVIEQLESLRCSAEYMSHEKDVNEVLIKDVVALNTAIDCVKKRRKEDVYIIKATIVLTITILCLIFIFWNMV